MFICLAIFFAPFVLGAISIVEAIKNGRENSWDKHSVFRLGLGAALNALMLIVFALAICGVM